MWLGLLYTFRAAGALKGWCAVRTLQTSILYKVELREIKRTVNERESENFIHTTPLLGVSDRARRVSK